MAGTSDIDSAIRRHGQNDLQCRSLEAGPGSLFTGGVCAWIMGPKNPVTLKAEQMKLVLPGKC